MTGLQDERKIGRLVQDTMKELSEMGFEFSEEQLGKFCTKKWSKETLGLYYPLFKIYDDSLPIEEQVKDHRDNNRYYGKIYSFGNGEQKLLITSISLSK